MIVADSESAGQMACKPDADKCISTYGLAEAIQHSGNWQAGAGCDMMKDGFPGKIFVIMPTNPR